MTSIYKFIASLLVLSIAIVGCRDLPDFKEVNDNLHNLSESEIEGLFLRYYVEKKDKRNKNIFSLELTIENLNTKYRSKLSTFKKNVEKVIEHNKKNLTWTEGINQFSDLTDEEFKEKHTIKMDFNEIGDSFDRSRLVPVKLDENNRENLRSGILLSIDHRAYLPKARQQGNCGSCYAFTAALALAGNHAIAHGITPFWLSPQQMVDCNPYTYGCKGGLGPTSMKYIWENGLVREEDYPYFDGQGYCKLNSSKGRRYGSPLSASTEYRPLEEWHQNLIGGPMFVGVDSATLQRYTGGIIDFRNTIPLCNEANHAVTAVGYGYDSYLKREYIIIRNSWGENWGEKGDFRAYVDHYYLNTCFITRFSYRPIPYAH